MKKKYFILMSNVSRLYHTSHFLKDWRLGLTRNVHPRHGEKRQREREREKSYAWHATHRDCLAWHGNERNVMPGKVDRIMKLSV